MPFPPCCSVKESGPVLGFCRAALYWNVKQLFLSAQGSGRSSEACAETHSRTHRKTRQFLLPEGILHRVSITRAPFGVLIGLIWAFPITLWGELPGATAGHCMSSCLIPGDSGDIGNVFWGNSVLIASFLRSRLGLELCFVSKTLIRRELTLPLEILLSKSQGCLFPFPAPLTQVLGVQNIEHTSPEILFSHIFCPVIRVLYKGEKRHLSVFRELISAACVGVKKQQSSGMWANSAYDAFVPSVLSGLDMIKWCCSAQGAEVVSCRRFRSSAELTLAMPLSEFEPQESLQAIFLLVSLYYLI